MKITKIYKRNGTVVPFDQSKITQAIFKAAAELGGHDMELAKQLSNKVVDILKNHFPKTIPTVEEIQDVVERVLIKNKHSRTAKAYILYRQKRKELRDGEGKKKIENIPYQTIWQSLVWSLDHDCETIEKLNEYVRTKTLGKLVKASEYTYQQEILNISSLIEKKLGQIRLLIITGPSSSGKTTTTDYLSQKLKKQKFSLVKLNVDNYFYDIKHQIKDGFDDYDFEGPYALDLPLINQHLTDLLAGKKAKIPFYNFKTNTREQKTTELQLKPNQILLIDSHFGIYPKLTESIADNQKYKIYLETLCQLRDRHGWFVRWTDIRMLRRMIRDSQFRSYNPVQTVGHWHYVRQGELKNIIPYISTADYILNTSLAYELPILKHYLAHYFPKIISVYKKETKRQDAYFRAKRVGDLLDQILEWPDTSIVPKKSILREFIG